MTYPPQPPGPHGQQPDPYGQQPYGDPYGQQQQGGYGQQPWGAVPPGYTGPPKKSKSGLIATLIIVGILVLGGGGVGIYLLAKDDDSGNGNTSGPVDNNPQAVAERLAGLYEQVINTDLADFDTNQWKQVLCGSDFEDLQKDFNNTRKLRESRGRQPSKRPPDALVDIAVKDLKVDGNAGTFTLVLNDPTADGTGTGPRKLVLQKDSERWVACGLYKPDDSPSSTRRPTPTRPSPSR